MQAALTGNILVQHMLLRAATCRTHSGVMNSAGIMDQPDAPPPDSSVHKPVPVLDAAFLSSLIAEEPLLSAHSGSTPMDVANISADQVS
jgi:hypothetical protein